MRTLQARIDLVGDNAVCVVESDESSVLRSPQT